MAELLPTASNSVKQPVTGRPAGSRDDVGPGPELLVGVGEVGDDEVVLGGEVPVQGGLGDPGPLDDQVDPDGVEAVLVEQAGGGVEDPPWPTTHPLSADGRAITPGVEVGETGDDLGADPLDVGRPGRRWA